MDSNEDVYCILDTPPILVKILKQDVMLATTPTSTTPTTSTQPSPSPFDTARPKRNYPVTCSPSSISVVDLPVVRRASDLRCGESVSCADVIFAEINSGSVGGLCITLIDQVFVFLNEATGGGTIYRISRATKKKEEKVVPSEYLIKKVRSLSFRVTDMAISRDSSRLYLLTEGEGIQMLELIKNYNFFLFFTFFATKHLVMDVIIHTYVYFLKIHD
jgi:hypothetical protein